MYWRATGQISDERYSIYRPIVLFFRMLGLFPVTVKRNRSKLLLCFSPLLTIYGFTFGAIAIVMAYWGIITEITVNKEEAIRVTSDIDKLMFMLGLVSYSSIFCCGMFLSPAKYKSFFKYLQFLYEVDCIIKTSYKSLEKYIMMIAMTIVVIFNMTLGYINISDCYKIVGYKIGLLGVLQRFAAVDFIVVMVNIIECINQLMLYGVRKRIKRLNVLLKIQYDQLKNIKMVDEMKPVVVFSREQMSENYIIAEAQWIEGNQIENVIKLSKSYQIILDTADVLNDFLGVSTLTMVVAIFWGLIESSYFFLLAFTENRGELRDAIEIPGAVALILFHTFRVLLITEPTHACLAQIETTKCLVCKLLSCKTNRNYRKTVNRFAMVLELRKLEFSAKGLFNVDRALFTSLLDTIVTLLVILLQYRKDFTLEL